MDSFRTLGGAVGERGFIQAADMKNVVASQMVDDVVEERRANNRPPTISSPKVSAKLA